KESMINFVYRRLHEYGGVEWNRINQSFWKIPCYLRHRSSNPFDGIESVRFRQLINRNSAGVLAVQFEKLAVGLCPQFHPGDVTQAGNLSTVIWRKLNDNVFEFSDPR